MDLREIIKGKENALERLMEQIPGFQGYMHSEKLRDSDKLHRRFISNKLTIIKNEFSEKAKELINAGHIAEMEVIDQILKKFDLFRDKIEFAQYGYSGIFDAVKIHKEDLNKIYEYDLGLVELTDALSKLIKEWDASNYETFKTTISQIKEMFLNLEDFFVKRIELIKGGKD